jgi:dTMP kinase
MGERDLQRWRELLKRREASRGMLVAFEGPDGSGKTTQRKLFKQWLKSEGAPVTTTKWNSSALIKPLVKVRKHVRALSPEEFCFLHAADFRHRLETEVLPALWEGTTVVADRYLFTALARDAARGLPFDWLLNVYAPILWPDVVFYFAVSPDTSGMRIAATREPKYYEAGQDITGIDDPHASYKQFISRVIREYEALALIFRFVTIDAERSINEQHREIREHHQQLQRLSWPVWNVEPVAEWLAHQAEATRLRPEGLRRGKPAAGVVAI